MAFFFLLAGKEIREAMLPGGPLANARTAALPILATIGGMAGPATIYAVGASSLAPELLRGWAVPMATDIAFSYPWRCSSRSSPSPAGRCRTASRWARC